MTALHDAAKAAALRAALNKRDYLWCRGIGVGTGAISDDVIACIVATVLAVIEGPLEPDKRKRLADVVFSVLTPYYPEGYEKRGTVSYHVVDEVLSALGIWRSNLTNDG